jgi:Glycosyltransferase
MNILFLASWYPTAKDRYSGLFIKKHAVAAKESGNEVAVLAIVIHRSKRLWKKSVEDSCDENGVRTILVEIETRFRDIIYHLIPLQYRIVKKIFNRDISKSFFPDLIHSNVVFPAGIIGDKLARALHVPNVVTEHWTQVRKFFMKPLLSRMGANAYANAARILPVSQFLKQEIVEAMNTKLRLTEVEPADAKTVANSGSKLVDCREEWRIFNGVDKFCVIGNVVDPEIFAYKPKIPKDGEVHICSIGTWNKTHNLTKRPEILIEALSLLQPELDKKIKLTMIGGGNRLEELKELCRNRGINAEFVGYLPSQEIASILHSSDYMAHCSDMETFCIVVAEAIMTGTPVICSNVGALGELMSDESGVAKGIMCENTVNDWHHKLKIALLRDFDNEAIAIEIRNKYTPQAISRKLGEVYDELFCQIKKID